MPDVFDVFYDRFEVSRLHRPNIAWRLVDHAGHEHRWYDGEQPATTYRPTATYTTPRLVWIKDGEELWEDDDEPHAVGHLECRICGERIEPGYTADRTPQYVRGLAHYTINGEPVGEDEFRRRFAAAHPDA